MFDILKIIIKKTAELLGIVVILLFVSFVMWLGSQILGVEHPVKDKIENDTIAVKTDTIDLMLEKEERIDYDSIK